MKLAALIPVFLLSSMVRVAPTRAGLSLSESDKVQIVRSILLRTKFLGEGEQSKTVYLSTKHIPVQLLKEMPAVEGVTFVLMTPAEVAEKAEKGFEYYAFSDFRVRGRAVRISFVEYYVVGATGFQSDAGREYEYRKVRGEWRGKIHGIILGMS